MWCWNHPNTDGSLPLSPTPPHHIYSHVVLESPKHWRLTTAVTYSTTSHLQPCGAGIIQTLTAHYRCHLHHHITFTAMWCWNHPNTDGSLPLSPTPPHHIYSHVVLESPKHWWLTTAVTYSTTSHLQPCGAGITRTLMAHYRCHLLHHITFTAMWCWNHPNTDGSLPLSPTPPHHIYSHVVLESPKHWRLTTAVTYSTTSHLQPCGAGITQTLTAHYRCHLLHHITCTAMWCWNHPNTDGSLPLSPTPPHHIYSHVVLESPKHWRLTTAVTYSTTSCRAWVRSLMQVSLLKRLIFWMCSCGLD